MGNWKLDISHTLPIHFLKAIAQASVFLKVIKVGVLKEWIMISFCQEMDFVVAIRGEISVSLVLSSPHSFSLATKQILGPAERFQEDALLVPKYV